jgi:hypothetical protein
MARCLLLSLDLRLKAQLGAPAQSIAGAGQRRARRVPIGKFKLLIIGVIS